MYSKVVFLVKGLIFVCIISAFYIDITISLENCRTPNGENGECIPIKQCSSLLTLLQEKPINSTSVEFLRQSQCGYDEKNSPKVCCPLNITNPEKLLPVESQCGIISEDKISGGETAGLDEFPWMALISYEKNNTRSFRCGGFLINNRYVVTAAHCLRTIGEMKIIGVRLGEYDIKSAIDCIDLPFTKQCASAPFDVPVEEIISHENYSAKTFHHNIGLLRLAQEAPFSDYIQPVCLPILPEYRKKVYTEKQLYVAGWGTTETGLSSDVKLKVPVPVWNISACNDAYNKYNITIGEHQICAGGEKGKDSCSGDSGNALMTINVDKSGEARWYAAGVTSFGPKLCGLSNAPAVYTNVGNYIEWIISKLRP